MTNALTQLDGAGVSIWLDKLSREMIEGGELAALIDRRVTGVTTNPTIFAKALGEGDAYDAQLSTLAAKGASVDDAIFDITTDDVRSACDVFTPVFERTNGQDGRVSIEVQPGLAYNTDATIAEAKHLARRVDRPNVMVKIPATAEGLPAITAATAAGINVNVTLIFSQQRYREVAEAYVAGLRQAQQNGHDLSQIRSVASIFLSRIDTKVDAALENIGTEDARALQGTAAIANARVCYRIAEEVFGAGFDDLRSAGAHAQRPLWASTGVKNENYRNTLYVDTLIAPDVVNTMPPATLEAVAAELTDVSNTIEGTYEDAAKKLADIEGLGVNIDEIMNTLESEGVDSFDASWAELTDTVRAGLESPDAG